MKKAVRQVALLALALFLACVAFRLARGNVYVDSIAVNQAGRAGRAVRIVPNGGQHYEGEDSA